jgi:transposase
MNLLETELTQEEIRTLDELSRHHCHGNFRPRALGLLSLNEGMKVEVISKVLRTRRETVYRWAQAWREEGLAGILRGHVGGRPGKLKPQWLDSAAQIAQSTALTLRGIAQAVKEQHPEIEGEIELRQLARGLRARKLSFKRTRLSLKKKEM